MEDLDLGLFPELTDVNAIDTNSQQCQDEFVNESAFHQVLSNAVGINGHDYLLSQTSPKLTTPLFESPLEEDNVDPMDAYRPDTPPDSTVDSCCASSEGSSDETCPPPAKIVAVDAPVKLVTPVKADSKLVVKLVHLRELPKSPKKRKMSELSDDRNSLSKNALAARENRLRKKKYVQELETSVRKLSLENADLKSDATRKANAIADLEEENVYLRNVLANASEISHLLQNIQNTPGLRFTTSLGRKRPAVDEEKPKRKTKTRKMADADVNAGVCLHVSGKRVSVEFCPKCNDSASKCDDPV